MVEVFTLDFQHQEVNKFYFFVKKIFLKKGDTGVWLLSLASFEELALK